MRHLLTALLLVAGIWSRHAAAEIAPKTFFRDGLWAPSYGDLGFDSSTIGGVDVVVDHLKVGIQVLRFGDFSFTGGYGGVGISGGPWQKTDAPHNYRTHFHGPVLEFHFLPDFFVQGSLAFMPMSGSVHYEKKMDSGNEKISHTGSMTDIQLNAQVRVWTDIFVNLGVGSRSIKISGEDEVLETGGQSSGLIVLGVRGSTL